ncbi:putative pectinesterase inhibitor domain-containing protein [Arabidopsis thaliana]
MAFSCLIRNVFSIIPLLVILSITPLSSTILSLSPNDKIRKDLVNQLCSQPTISKQFCLAWLTSFPNTFTLDMQGLVNMVYQQTERLGYKNLEMIKGLDRTENYSKLKKYYRSCVKEYELSNKAIEEAKGFASSKAYRSASEAAARAFDSISMCEAYLEGSKTPGYVTTRNWWFERMCDIDKIFTDLLISAKF